MHNLFNAQLILCTPYFMETLFYGDFFLTGKRVDIQMVLFRTTVQTIQVTKYIFCDFFYLGTFRRGFNHINVTDISSVLLQTRIRGFW